MKSVLIAVPTAKYIESETFRSIYDLTVPGDMEVNFRYFAGYQIDHIRNMIAASAKAYDYLLAVDSDMVLPKDTLVRLSSHDVGYVSGVYVKKRLDLVEYELYKKNEQGKLESMTPVNKSIFPIDASGFGCVLMKTSILDSIESPYFFNTTYDPSALTLSEDLYFCKKLRNAGVIMWADPLVVCGHIGSHVYNPK